MTGCCFNVIATQAAAGVAVVNTCGKQPAYLIRWEGIDQDYPACADHTAEARACDPLDYIESVRSIVREVPA